jgi:hypothetical protein
MVSTDNPYILTEDDLEHAGTEDRPEIRAARNPDSRVLIALNHKCSNTELNLPLRLAIVDSLTKLFAVVKADCACTGENGTEIRSDEMP